MEADIKTICCRYHGVELALQRPYFSTTGLTVIDDIKFICDDLSRLLDPPTCV